MSADASTATPAAESSAAPNLLSGAGQQTATAAVAAATTGTPAASWTWADDTGKLNDGWVDKLGDDFKGNPTLATIRDLPTLAKAYLDTKKLVGAKVGPPGDGATPEQVAAWRRTLGIPDKPEDYGQLMPDGFANNLTPRELAGLLAFLQAQTSRTAAGNGARCGARHAHRQGP